MQHRRAFALSLLAAAVSGPHHGVPSGPPVPARAETWAAAPGPRVGTVIPAFELRDQDGRPRTFDSLKGRAGLVLNFNRSVNWCPYCKSQLVELGRQVESFRARGLEIAAIVPEPVADLKAFTTRLKIPFPILSDADSSVVRRFGLEDTRGGTYVPHPGLPYAGNLYLDAGGTVRDRYFEQEVETRRTAGSILLQQGGRGRGGQQVELAHFVLGTSASNTELAPGQRFTLALDLALQEKHHLYAPGVSGYRPLKLVLDPNPLFEAHPPQFPAARSYYYAPLQETVPVFEGQVRVLQDLTLAFRPALAALGRNGEHDVALTGTLEYQVCSDRVCYPPGAAPVRWTVHLQRWTK
jgi:peroxiredoxin